MDEPIAIIGLDSRLPGDAETPEKLYEFLLAGRSARTDMPSERFNVDSFWHPDGNRPGNTRARAGHFLKENVAAFDAPFFSITPAEAQSMDPQQRILLECTYRALENAGLQVPALAGSQTGVYVGCFYSDYNTILEKDLDNGVKHVGTGTIISMLSNRLSWAFDFRGPSITIDTACSGSLVAAHLACMSLKSGEISMGIVAGSNLILSPEMTLKLNAAGVSSPTGTSYSFDHRANGYARGEAIGVLVLKRLSDAIRDGDVIRAVIRGSGVNADGRPLGGITQPTKMAQAALIKQVYSRAGLDPSLTRFFEAHGTGTPVGDPIEASAIAEIFSAHRSPESPLYVGALKSNFGHSEGAAGVSSIIKGVLTLERGIIPANAWFEKANPGIEESWNLKFPTEATVWPQPGLRRISINSFGIGGTNAHMVLDDAFHHLKDHCLVGKNRSLAIPSTINIQNDLTLTTMCISPRRDRTLGHISSNAGIELDDVHLNKSQDSGNSPSHAADEVKKLQVFVWSSHDQDGISRQRNAYSSYLSSRAKVEWGVWEKARFLGDFSHTLAQKRTHHGWRSFVVAGSLFSLQESLGKDARPVRASSEPRLAFIFTGQGAQWPKMGRELMTYSVFQESLYKADLYLNGLGCRWSLICELFKDKLSSRINDPEFSQPLCTALQVALVDLLASWGVHPQAIAGHSSGEIAAAYAAEQLSRESAWKIAYYRGTLSAALSRSNEQQKSGMAAVALDKEGTMQAIKRVSDTLGRCDLEIACMNGPESHTVSGNVAHIDALMDMLKSEMTFGRKLNVDIGYHSRFMKPICDEYLELIADIHPGNESRSRKVIYFSSLNGTLVDSSLLQRPQYWVDNLVSPVRFNEAVTALFQCHQVTDVLEIGPHSALKGPLRSIAGQVEGGEKINYHCILFRNTPAVASALEAAGSLFCRGFDVSLGEVNNHPIGPEDYVPLMLTDLPGYSFNHANEYWVESRLSRNNRNRASPRHELLGAPVPDWNKENATWRNYIRVSENPWIEDHQVQGNILYPAAGMLVMAIEACRQIADNNKVMQGVRFKNVSLHSALHVPDDPQGIESHFYLRPHWDSTANAKPSWSMFQLCTFQDGDWREHCRGLVQIEYQSEQERLDSGLDRQKLQTTCDQELSSAQRSCQTKLQSKRLYSAFREMGLEFGPMFQTLQDVSVGPEFKGLMRVASTVPDIVNSMPHGYMQPHLVHPTTLDGLFQASIAPMMMQGSTESPKTMVPVYLDQLWVSATPLTAHDDGYSVSTQANQQGRHMNEVKISSIAVHPESGQVAARVDGLVFKAVSRQTTQMLQDDPKHRAWHIEWKSDPAYLGLDECCRGLGIPGPASQDPYNYLDDSEHLCLLYLHRLLDQFNAEGSQELELHFHQYISWAKDLLNDKYQKISHMNLEELEGKIQSWNLPEGNLVMAVGQALLKIFDGSINPLEVIFRDTLSQDFYLRGEGFQRCHAQMKNYLDTLTHKKPSVKILEIGAGTGSTTKPVIDILTQYGQRYEHFDFTDISPSFLDQAKEAFRDQGEHMSFRVLNIEKPIQEQGFELGTYDIIVAAKVLHATSRIQETLKNVRSLLKPGGKLVLFEITQPTSIYMGFIFGLLPGWWLSADADRVTGPLLSTDSWKQHLVQSGFDGLDAVFNDFPDAAHQTTSILISTAVRETVMQNHTAASTFHIFMDDSSPFQQEVAHGILRKLAPRGICGISSLHSLPTGDLDASTCIVLSELEATILEDMTNDVFVALQRLMSCKSLFWLTMSGSSLNVPSPDKELVTGLARTIRTEKPDFKFTTISFEQSTHAQGVIDKSIQIILSENEEDNTFRVENNIIKIPRLIEAKDLASHIRYQTKPSEVVEEKLGSSSSRRPLALDIGTAGNLDSLIFEDDTTYHSPMAEGDVEFKIMASGINFRDLAISLGKTGEAPIGLEASGVVTRVGSGVTQFQEGDRVFGLAFNGAIKTYGRTRQGFLAHVPDSMSWADAASIPIVYTTAYAALHAYGTVRKGDTILIHRAANGLGQASIQIAQHFGAEVFATVSTEEKRRFLKSTYGIPHDHIFSSRDISFHSGIQSMTRGRGVDTVLNSLSGEGLNASWNCIAPLGRFVELGVGDNESNGQLPMGNSNRNTRFESVELTYMALHDPIHTERIFQQATQLVLSGQLNIKTPITRFSYAEVQTAFRYMQAAKHIGKLVLEPLDTDVVPVLPSHKPVSRFIPEATYVIAGGLGGLGRSVAEWMVSRGAKNLILLSRRGPVEDSAKAFVRKLESLCDNVIAPACDVTNIEVLRASISDCLKAMPPIKGCIQGSMVLNDNRFEKMTLEQWNATVNVKAQGSLNLHRILGDGLEFFMIFSSTSAIIGGPEQSNYAAAGTYQDALARQLASQGILAVSINLPVITGVGMVSENPELMDHLRSVGWAHINEQEFHATLDYYCGKLEKPWNTTKAQAIPRLWLPQYSAAEGTPLPKWRQDPLFCHLALTGAHAAAVDGVSSTKKDQKYGAVLAAVTSSAEADRIVLEALLAKLARVLSVELEHLDPAKPLFSYGVDSLVSIEIKSWMAREIGAELSSFDITSQSRISQLAKLAASRSKFVPNYEAAQAANGVEG